MINKIKVIRLEEDMFPRTFMDFTDKDFGILFYNKNSYNSKGEMIDEI